MKKFTGSFWKMILVAALGICTANVYASYPKGYYDTLDGKCGVELMRAVKDLSKNHTVIPYRERTWEAFAKTDVKEVDGKQYWWDMYSNELVEVSSGHAGLNIEHSVANSWWGHTENAAYKDIFHLNPSNAEANNRKSNYPLCEVGTVKWTNGVTIVGKPRADRGCEAPYVYEPVNDYKGDFARVFMYIFATYDDIDWQENTAWMYRTNYETLFRPWAITLLMDWNKLDPVSDKELSRNEAVYGIQHNRNAFIDLPDLGQHIWGSLNKIPYKVEGAGQPDDPDDPDTPGNEDIVTYEWLASNSTEMSEGWTIDVVSKPDQIEKVIWWDNYKGNYFLKASCFYKGQPYAGEAYAWSPVVDLTDAESASFTFDHAAYYQTTLRQLCGLVVREEGSTSMSNVSIRQWPDKGNWDFRNSGDIDLSYYAGKKIQIGFRYKSDSTGADTWEVNNCRLTVSKKAGSGIKDVPAVDDNSDDSFLVEVWGNNILAPEGAVIFDMSGRRRDGSNLDAGVYVVVKPSFRKSVKVIIR